MEGVSDMNERAHTGSNGAVLRVSLVYMMTGFVMFLTFGLLGLVMRLDHARWLTLSPDWFYRIMTIHGAGMVTAMLLAAMGALTATLSRSMSFSTMWLWVAFMTYFSSAFFVLLPVLVGGFISRWGSASPMSTTFVGTALLP